MKTSKNEVFSYLLSDARFRERKNKNKGLANLLITKYPFLRDIPRETIIDVLIDYATMNRWWNRILQRRIDLRGLDYNDKFVLEKQSKERFGYGKS